MSDSLLFCVAVAVPEHKTGAATGIMGKFCFERWIQRTAQAALGMLGILAAPDAAVRPDVSAHKGSAVLEFGLFLRDVGDDDRRENGAAADDLSAAHDFVQQENAE